MREIGSIAELRSLIGQELAVTDWFAIHQERVTQFAEATGDHQWIHLDVERCKKESPTARRLRTDFSRCRCCP
jgi:acyl dehydratase